MAWYMLTINGAMQPDRARQFDAKPPDLPHKGMAWLPMVEEPPPLDPTTQEAVATGWVASSGKAVRTYDVQALRPAVVSWTEKIEARILALEKKAGIA